MSQGGKNFQGKSIFKATQAAVQTQRRLSCIQIELLQSLVMYLLNDSAEVGNFINYIQYI